VLERLQPNTTVLDVGIGTGKALINNADLIVKKRLQFVGVDYDEDYILRCKQLIDEAQLQDSIRATCESIYDFKGIPGGPTRYDAAYFSGSLMIMPDPVAALRHVKDNLLKPGGMIYTTQTFEAKRNPVLEKLKPMLKFLTTIDFGRVTYEKDFLVAVQKAGLVVKERVSLSGDKSGKGSNARQFMLYALQPGSGSSGSSGRSTKSNKVE